MGVVTRLEIEEAWVVRAWSSTRVPLYIKRQYNALPYKASAKALTKVIPFMPLGKGKGEGIL